MKYFVALRPNSWVRAGQWLMGLEVGEELFKCRLTAGPEGSKFIQESQIPIPFEAVAGVIVELDFTIPQSELRKSRPDSMHHVKEVEDFQRDNEEMIEDAFLKKKREEFPSYKSKSGIIVPGQFNGNNGKEGTK